MRMHKFRMKEMKNEKLQPRVRIIRSEKWAACPTATAQRRPPADAGAPTKATVNTRNQSTKYTILRQFSTHFSLADLEAGGLCVVR